MFEKLPYEMTTEEIEKEVKEYFDMVENEVLLEYLLEAGFKWEDLNLKYFFKSDEEFEKFKSEWEKKRGDNK